MSVIAATKHYDHGTGKFLRSIIIASKGNSARCMEATLNFLVSTDDQTPAKLLMDKIKLSMRKDDRDDPVFLQSLHLFSNNVNDLIANKDKAPHEIVKELIREFTAFRATHNLPYIDIRDAMDQTLLSLTISHVSRNPDRFSQILEQSIGAFKHAVSRKNDYGIPNKRKSATNVSVMANFNKLKGLLELVRDDIPRKLDFGNTARYPAAVTQDFKHHLQKLFKHEQAFESAIGVLDLTKTYRAFPTGKSGMLIRRDAPQFIDGKYVINKLSEIYREHGKAALQSQVANLSDELRASNAGVYIRIASYHPEQIELFKHDKFSSKKYEDFVYDFAWAIKDNNKLTPLSRLQKIYHNGHPVVFGPDFPLVTSLFNPDEVTVKITLREVVLKRFPDADPAWMDLLWNEMNPGAPTDSILVGGDLLNYPEVAQQKPKRSL